MLEATGQLASSDKRPGDVAGRVNGVQFAIDVFVTRVGSAYNTVQNDIHLGSLIPLTRLLIGILTLNPRPLFRLSPSLSAITEKTTADCSTRPSGGAGAWLCN